jgi:hypothetical protein
MTVRGPDRALDQRRAAGTHTRVRGPAWNTRTLVAVILAIVAVALVIWFAAGG